MGWQGWAIERLLLQAMLKRTDKNAYDMCEALKTKA